MAASPYSDPVDHKKLRFILAAMERHATATSRRVEDLAVLEVACGSGGITLPLATLGCRVRAFDIDRTAVSSLRDALADRPGADVTVTVDDAYTFDDGCAYDVVIASEVFEHVLDPDRLADAVVSRMAPDGLLVVTTPNGYGPWEMGRRISPRQHLARWAWLRRRLGKPPLVKGDGAAHCQFYTRRRLETLFVRRSLRIGSLGRSDSLLAAVPGLRHSGRVASADCRLADVLPSWLASGWYFTFESNSASMATGG